MKYWWLEKYINITINEIHNLHHDVNYFLTMPNKYMLIHENIKNKKIDELLEEELLIELFISLEENDIEKIKLIIEKLLLVPDTNLPISDYTFKEILEEIKNINNVLPLQEKLNNNNIGACFNCNQIFYLDKVKSVNKKNLVLCPFCNKDTLYFDNDFIPMNYSFMTLASIYYKVSELGCKFKNIQTILKKNIIVTMTSRVTTNTKIDNIDEKNEYYISLEEFSKKRLDSYIESKIIKEYYDKLIAIDNSFERETTIILDANRRIDEIILLVLIAIMKTLSSTIYLNKINIICTDIKVYEIINMFIKLLIKFK